MDVAVAASGPRARVLNDVVPLEYPAAARVPQLFVDARVLDEAAVRAPVAARHDHVRVAHFAASLFLYSSCFSFITLARFLSHLAHSAFCAFNSSSRGFCRTNGSALYAMSYFTSIYISNLYIALNLVISL